MLDYDKCQMSSIVIEVLKAAKVKEDQNIHHKLRYALERLEYVSNEITGLKLCIKEIVTGLDNCQQLSYQIEKTKNGDI